MTRAVVTLRFYLWGSTGSARATAKRAFSHYHKNPSMKAAISLIQGMAGTVQCHQEKHSDCICFSKILDLFLIGSVFSAGSSF
jgi:hypothetical protein